MRTNSVIIQVITGKEPCEKEEWGVRSWLYAKRKSTVIVLGLYS
jgi:hypothetical protein